MTVCSKDLKFGPIGDCLNGDVVGIIIIEKKNVSVAACGWDKEGASLIGRYFACCFEAGGVDLVSLGGIGFNSIEDMMWCDVLSLG